MYFLHKLDRLECDEFRVILSEKVGIHMVPLSSPSQIAKGNMANLSPMTRINISHDPGKIENVYIGVECFLDDVFPSDEAIIEAMSTIEQPWGEMHHRSYFLHKLDHLECDDFRRILRKKVGSPVVPLSFPGQMAERNMSNLSP